MVTQFWALIAGGLLPAATVVARVAVGAILLAAGAAKIRAGESRFFEVVLAYDLLPAVVARWLARLLPLAEVGVGGLLILGLLTLPAAIAGSALLVAFTAATALALARGKQIPCGCFGLRETLQPVRWTILIRNLVLILALVAVFMTGAQGPAVDRLLLGLGVTSQWLTGLALALGLAVSIRQKSARKREQRISIA